MSKEEYEKIITSLINISSDSADLYWKAILVTDVVKLLRKFIADDEDIIRFKNATFKKNNSWRFMPIENFS